MAATIVTTDQLTNYDLWLEPAASALRAGRLAIFPTETVYGIGANAADPAALAALRAAKGRPETQPFTVHIGQRADVRLYVTRPSLVLRRLVRKLWPGPLTLLCEEPDPAAAPIAARVPASQLDELYHQHIVGLRCPDHPAAARLLTAAGVPVVASSANRSGRPAPTEFAAAVAEVGEHTAFALDGGKTRYATASTIVAVRGNRWEIQRAGAIDERTLQRAARSEVLFVCTGNSCRSPMAEHLFRRRLAERLALSEAGLAEAGYAVSSAGVAAYAGMPASKGAREEMRQRGIDLERHQAQPLTPELLRRAERVFVMSPEHLTAVVRYAGGAGLRVELLDAGSPISDPMGGGPEEYRRAAQQIEQAVDRRLEEYLDEDRDW